MVLPMPNVTTNAKILLFDAMAQGYAFPGNGPLG
jgi:hypothetical protein